MRAFARPSGLSRLSLEARIVYTGFCLFMLVGYASAVWFYLDDHLDSHASSATRYYLGDDAQSPSTTAPSDAVPAIDLPDETPAQTPLAFAKSPRQMMETFHFHLFTVSVCLLILAHLFMMCALPTSAKATIVATAWLATLAHLLAPPLIRFASPRFAGLMFPSAIAMAATWTLLTVWPVVEMWRLPARKIR